MSDLTQEFFDIKAYLDDRNITHAFRNEEWLNLNCPWCNDNQDHMGISIISNRCHCWKCGNHNIGKFVQLTEDCDWSEAMAVMEQFQNYDRALLTESSQFTPPKQIEMPKEFISLEDPKITVKIVDDFLAKRGFDPTTTRINHSIHYSPGPAGDYKFRIAWPVYIGNQLVTFMTRDVTGRAKVPYIAQPVKEAVIPCKHTLYGYDDVAPGSNIVIVEGPIDQMKLGRGALATWGTGWTIEQVALIKSLHPNKVTILYDSEEIAQEAAKRLDKAIWFCPSEVMYLDDHNDPGELTLEEGREIMRSLT